MESYEELKVAVAQWAAGFKKRWSRVPGKKDFLDGPVSKQYVKFCALHNKVQGNSQQRLSGPVVPRGPKLGVATPKSREEARPVAPSVPETKLPSKGRLGLVTSKPLHKSRRILDDSLPVNPVVAVAPSPNQGPPIDPSRLESSPVPSSTTFASRPTTTSRKPVGNFVRSDGKRWKEKKKPLRRKFTPKQAKPMEYQPPYVAGNSAAAQADIIDVCLDAIQKAETPSQATAKVTKPSSVAAKAAQAIERAKQKGYLAYKSVPQQNVPTCTHGIECKLRKVKKEGVSYTPLDVHPRGLTSSATGEQRETILLVSLWERRQLQFLHVERPMALCGRGKVFGKQ